MSIEKEINLDGTSIADNDTHQFATVIFDRDEDNEAVHTTVIVDDGVETFIGTSQYNPSRRRHSTCVYIADECTCHVSKVAVIQHKGKTLVEVHRVGTDEITYLASKSSLFGLALLRHLNFGWMED